MFHSSPVNLFYAHVITAAKEKKYIYKIKKNKIKIFLFFTYLQNYGLKSMKMNIKNILLNTADR